MNRRHKCGNTSLWEAAFHGREDTVAALLAAGADANVYADDGGGPLHWAVSKGHGAVVEVLLAHGADPNALRNGDYSVLAAAIVKGDAAVVRRLVEAGAAVDHRYFGRLMPEYARYCGQTEIADWLRRWRRTKPADPLRCVFGKPFRPVAFDPRWRTSDVLGLARGIDDERGFDRLPILADALMDAGCDGEEILAHCRSDGQHVRGCWVVDLVLGKQ